MHGRHVTTHTAQPSSSVLPESLRPLLAVADRVHQGTRAMHPYVAALAPPRPKQAHAATIAAIVASPRILASPSVHPVPAHRAALANPKQCRESCGRA